MLEGALLEVVRRDPTTGRFVTHQYLLPDDDAAHAAADILRRYDVSAEFVRVIPAAVAKSVILSSAVCTILT